MTTRFGLFLVNCAILTSMAIAQSGHASHPKDPAQDSPHQQSADPGATQQTLLLKAESDSRAKFFRNGILFHDVAGFGPGRCDANYLNTVPDEVATLQQILGTACAVNATFRVSAHSAVKSLQAAESLFSSAGRLRLR